MKRSTPNVFLLPYTTLFRSNNVYGLDPDTGQPKWPSITVGSPFLSSDIGCADLTPHIGITGTPVIDRARSEETRLNSSHMSISYAVFCLKKKKSSTAL